MTDLGEKCRRGPENHANNTNMRDGGMQSDFACDLSFFRIRVSVGPAGSSIGEGPRRAGPKYGRGRMTRGCHFAGHTGLSYSPSLRPVFIQSFMNRCSSTWNTPLAVIRNSGITGKARKESVPNGASRGHPIACAAWLTSSNWRHTVSASWSESRPATGRGSMARWSCPTRRRIHLRARPVPGRRRACPGRSCRQRSGCGNRARRKTRGRRHSSTRIR